MESPVDRIMTLPRKEIYNSTAIAMELLAEAITENYAEDETISKKEVLSMLNGFAKLSRDRAESL